MPRLQLCPTCQQETQHWWGAGNDNNWYCDQCTEIGRQMTANDPQQQEGSDNMLNFCLWCHEAKRLVPSKFTCYDCDNKFPLQVQAEQQAKQVQREQEIEQWKQKLTNFLTARKQKLLQEIQLIREVLND